MTWYVQKFGGTSLADMDRIRRCAGRAASAHLDGHRIVVVVSAMGRTTDELLALANAASDRRAGRDLDLLLASGEQVSAALMALALLDLGIPAASFTPYDLGIRTNDKHGDARIESVDARAIESVVESGAIAVVPGFVGTTERGQVTTLGRGGSDTTAVALAAALRDRAAGRVVECEIYTDVEGVFTADPREVLGARRLPRITHEQMLELAGLGARVLQSRAVIMARRHGVPIHVRHSVHADPGTLIQKERGMEHRTVIGCAMSCELGRITVTDTSACGTATSTVIESIADAGVHIDEILHVERGRGVELSLAIPADQLADAKTATQAALDRIGVGTLSVDVGLVKISVVGEGLRRDPGVAATLLRALGEANIDIAGITTSELRISCLVPHDRGQDAIQLAHDAFDLAEKPAAPESLGETAAGSRG